MRRFLIAALITTALTAPAVAQELKPIRSITVTGQAERKVVPDEAHVTVNVSALAATVQAAKADHDAKLKKVIAIAKAEGVDEAQIKTQSSNVQPQYTYDNNKRVFKGYQVATGLDITVKKTEILGSLVEKLTGAGLENKSANEWQGLVNVNYTLSNPDKIRDEMATAAIENARSKAERMANAAGASLGAVYQVSEGNAPSFNYPRPVPMMAMAKAGGMAADAVTPPAGEQEVNASVTVTYELK